MTELEDKVDRMEEVLKVCFRLARALRMKYNKTTKVFDSNFETFEGVIDQNIANVDKIVKKIQELIGEDSSKEKLPEIEEDEYTKRLYL